MASLREYFQEFLSAIEPSDAAVERAATAHKRVRDFLEADDNDRLPVVDSFLYGSYKRQTAVGEIKDVDVVVLLDLDTTSEDNLPWKVLRRLKTALARHYGKADMLEYQRRSIRVDEPLPDDPEAALTLDIIPAVRLPKDSEILLVPDRKQGEWIKSNPEGHLRRTTELNANSGQRFVPIVKALKWWWKHVHCAAEAEPHAIQPKGFWLECLAGEHAECLEGTRVEAFVALLGAIADGYLLDGKAPELADPGLPKAVLKTGLTGQRFEDFLRVVRDVRKKAEEATEKFEKDESAGVAAWRAILGDSFPEVKVAETLLLESRQSVVAHRQVPPWHFQEVGRVRLSASLYSPNRGKRLASIVSDDRTVRGGLWFRFLATVRDIRPPFEVFWQVVNTGEHARRVGGLRGAIFAAPERPEVVHWEQTLYTGRHWIECFVVKDKICVARSGRFFVNIVSHGAAS